MKEELKKQTETSNKVLLEQGIGAAQMVMSEAVEIIDQKFAVGYAEQHPELIAAFMNAAILDSSASLIARNILVQSAVIEDNLSLFNGGNH